MKTTLRFLVLAAALFIGNNAFAITLGFECTSFNVIGNCDVGEAAYSVDITEDGTGIKFEFNNTAVTDADTGSITGIAFVNSDDYFTGIEDEGFTGSVNISQDTPEHCPPIFGNGVCDLSFSADAPNLIESGIQEGESWYVTLTLDGGDLMTIIMALEEGEFIFGLHSQSIQCDGCADTSETFTVVPVPAAVWLFGSVLATLGLFRKRAEATA